MFDFTDKMVVITGAPGNLGSATARAFAAAGATLVLVHRSADPLEEVFDDLAESGKCMFIVADLTDPGAVEGMALDAVQQNGRIDVLVNIAGGFRSGTPVHETSPETWDFLMNLNAKTVLNTARAVVPHMLSQEYGKIVNISGRPGLSGKANVAAYAAAKSAVIRLTESMAAELRGRNINVNCVVPGTMDTPENRASMPNANFNRWVSPEEVANVILLLASDEAQAIHGAAVPAFGCS